MPKPKVRSLIEGEAQLLGPVLHASLATALAKTDRRRSGLPHSKYPFVVPMLVRTEMREALESELLPLGWTLGGDSRLMGQLLLRNADLAIEMRFLKERRRTYPGGVPVAGHSSTRRAFYVQGLLDDMPVPAAAAPSTSINLLVCWDLVTPGALEEFQLRMVHTLQPGTYGSAVPCDMVIELQGGSNMFTRLQFAGDDEDQDFFRVEIDEAEDEGEF